MNKNYLGIAVVLFLVGIVVAAQAQVQAQEGETMTQPTIDAAVATLIAQTQQPVITQTIQAALEQALTATAQAQSPPPTATPQPFDIENLSLGSTVEIDLLAGPGGTGAYLAPDGEHFAYLNDDAICIYEGDQEQTCVDISSVRSPDSESIRWSPDSRYLTLTENFFITFVDPDIWLIDANQGTLKNLTDDGVNRGSLLSDELGDIDLIPSWTDDGDLIFFRYPFIDRSPQPPEIHRIAVDGSGETLLGIVQTNDNPFAIYTIDVWRDKLIYVYAAQDETPDNGIWMSDLNGENAQQINHASREAPISAVEMSPDGQFVLYRTETTAFASEYSPENSWVRAVEVETGTEILLDSDAFVAGAGWSPQGSGLIYLTYDALEQSGNVYLSAAPGEAGKLLLEGRFNIGTPRLRQFLTWGMNNVVLLSKSPMEGIVLMGLE